MNMQIDGWIDTYIPVRRAGPPQRGPDQGDIYLSRQIDRERQIDRQIDKQIERDTEKERKEKNNDIPSIKI